MQIINIENKTTYFIEGICCSLIKYLRNITQNANHSKKLYKILFKKKISDDEKNYKKFLYTYIMLIIIIIINDDDDDDDNNKMYNVITVHGGMEGVKI